MLNLLRKAEKRKDTNIINTDKRLTDKAEADYIAEQEAKEARQAKGLGFLITPAQNETEEEIAAKKKRQGLGAVILGDNSTIG